MRGDLNPPVAEESFDALTTRKGGVE